MQKTADQIDFSKKFFSQRKKQKWQKDIKTVIYFMTHAM